MIQELHLIHHSHTDLGFTDLPGEARAMQEEWLRQAVALAELHAGEADEDARFRWVAECLVPVIDACRADPRLAVRLDRLVAAGLVEITAMPWNVGNVGIGSEEWASWRAWAAPWMQRFGVRTAMQNDVNGFSWGLLPGLIDDGVGVLSMGINVHSGGQPEPVPDAFRWQGPDGREVLVWSGLTYPLGSFFFHEREWRRGPVPQASDPWFHPPGSGDMWDASPAGLAKAHEVCARELARRLGGWKRPLVAVQVTNQWRMDNDPPDALIQPFVKAWNAAGLLPRLRLSTMGGFLARFQAVAGDALPRRRGDWQDWWTDGMAAFPVEQVQAGRAAALRACLPAAAGLLRTSCPDLRPGWLDQLTWHEHTFGAYDIVARPQSALAMGHRAETAAAAHRLAAAARRDWAAIARAAPAAVRSSQASAVLVLNPHPVPTAGWIELPADALPSAVGGLRHPDGRLLPFETVRGPAWSAPGRDLADAFNLPDDVWSQRALIQRVHVPELAAGAALRLAFADAAAPEVAAASGADRTWAWSWQDGRLVSLRHLASGAELIDAASPWGFAMVVVDRPEGAERWSLLEQRGKARAALQRTVPSRREWVALPSAYGASFGWRIEDPAWHRGEQRLRLLPDGTVEVTTRLWLREGCSPEAWWLMLPLAEPGRWSYDAVGHPTDVVRDQLPRTCGDHIVPGKGLVLSGSRLQIAIDCRDTPVVSLGGPTVRDGRLAGSPPGAAAMCLFCSYWITNFSTARPGLLETVHRLRTTAPGTDPWPQLGAGLLHLPGV